jgi:hypothetical protein
MDSATTKVLAAHWALCIHQESPGVFRRGVSTPNDVGVTVKQLNVLEAGPVAEVVGNWLA